MAASVVVVFDRTAEVAAALATAAAQLRQSTADAIKAASVDNAAEVTGALKASHYVTDERGSGYAAAVADAAAKNPAARFLPEVPAEPNTSIVAVAVEYAAPAEFYTGPTNPGAHPYLTPAAEQIGAQWERAIAELGGTIR